MWKNLFTKLALAALIFGSLAAQGQLRVQWLPQYHSPMAGEIDVRIVVIVLDSQRSIARWFQDHPGAIVFEEGFVGDLTTIKNTEFLSRVNVPVVRYAFPNGIPDKFENLSNAQVQLLAMHTGTEIAFALGYISERRGATSKELLEALHGEFEQTPTNEKGALPPEFVKKHEDATLGHISIYAEANRSRPVVLVFGASHDLVARNTDFPKLRIEIPADFTRGREPYRGPDREPEPRSCSTYFVVPH